MTPRHRTIVVTLVLAAVFVLPESVFAYGGPGSIVTGIGALLAAVAAVAAAVIGFFWFPLKRLMQKLRDRREDDESDVAEAH